MEQPRRGEGSGRSAQRLGMEGRDGFHSWSPAYVGTAPAWTAGYPLSTVPALAFHRNQFKVTSSRKPPQLTPVRRIPHPGLGLSPCLRSCWWMSACSHSRPVLKFQSSGQKVHLFRFRADPSGLDRAWDGVWSFPLRSLTPRAQAGRAGPGAGGEPRRGGGDGERTRRGWARGQGAAVLVTPEMRRSPCTTPVGRSWAGPPRWATSWARGPRGSPAA